MTKNIGIQKRGDLEDKQSRTNKNISVLKDTSAKNMGIHFRKKNWGFVFNCPTSST